MFYLLSDYGSTYTLWGKKICPGNGSTLVYTGIFCLVIVRIVINIGEKWREKRAHTMYSMGQFSAYDTMWPMVWLTCHETCQVKLHVYIR